MTTFPTELAVYISGTRCGLIREDRYGALSFEYDPEYRGIPLSLSMPVGLARYGDRTVRPYLMGLLPDDESTRAAIGASKGVSGNNPFRLLCLMGLDCPGAVQICPVDAPLATEKAEDNLVFLSDEEIGERLAAVRENAAAAWTGAEASEGHWSLGGCQAKIALRLEGDIWYECLGSAATTHILKPGVAGFEHQALVEYLSMETAREIGLPTAEVAYRTFGGEGAVVIKRYDRAPGDEGGVRRIHQEDLCQTLSVPPTAKYPEQGGPSTPQIIELLKRTGANARGNVYRFILYLLFNYLIGATDAHAKNHSLLFVGTDDVRLAPLYDVASMAPYRSLAPRQRKPLRTALSIGGENRFGLVGAEHVEKMVQLCGLESLGLDATFLRSRFLTMAEMVPEAVAHVLEDARRRGLREANAVAEPMRSEIATNCRRTIERL